MTTRFTRNILRSTGIGTTFGLAWVYGQWAFEEQRFLWSFCFFSWFLLGAYWLVLTVREWNKP